MIDTSTDPLLWTPEDRRRDLKVGERVEALGKAGMVVALTMDPSYPVKVLFDGEERPVQPIFNQIKRAAL